MHGNSIRTVDRISPAVAKWQKKDLENQPELDMWLE